MYVTKKASRKHEGKGRGVAILTEKNVDWKKNVDPKKIRPKKFWPKKMWPERSDHSQCIS